MRRSAISVLSCAFLLWSVGRLAAQQPPPPAPQSPQGAPQLPPASEETMKHLAALRQQIAGKENRPAGEVFKNMQVLKDMPAGRVLGIMRVAYAASLGVECSHCHIPGEWEKDDKAPKAVARQMWTFMRETNDRLAKIKQDAGVNCTTCHRGQIKPALSLPPK